MKRYITRHGAVVDYRAERDDHLYPPGDIPLSPLGLEQAQLLGKRMKRLGFRGLIVASPYIRTMQTAEAIAAETGALILPFAPLRERFKEDTDAAAFCGLTLEELRRRFAFIHPDATLPYPWWKNEGAEDYALLAARVKAGIATLEEAYPTGELLLVGHGASVSAALSVYGIRAEWYRRTQAFNCSLSAIDPEDADFTPLYCDTAHLPYEKTTSNHQSREEYDLAYFGKKWDAPINLPELSSYTGTRILHLGDTYSKFYPLYRALIKEIKPDVIIHTGDFADEVKVGRMPETRYEYLQKARVMTEMLAASGARVIITPGNNDLPEELARLAPFAEIYPTNSLVTVDGCECRIGHRIFDITFDHKVTFYGHGLAGERWMPEMNRADGVLRFNAVRGVTLCSLKEPRFALIPLPGCPWVTGLKTETKSKK